MQLTVVFDNSSFDACLQAAWGFAALLECREQTVLFDTGGDGAMLLRNMAGLDRDPRTINSIVLSHIHRDHTGGLGAVLAENPHVTVYVPQAFPATLKRRVRSSGATVVEVDGPVEIVPALWSTGQMGTRPVEQALVASTEQGLVVITGCAHPGVDKMTARAKDIGRRDIALVVGGFHLGAASTRRIQRILSEFQRLGVQSVAPCHCTGRRASQMLRQRCGGAFYASSVGWQWHSRFPHGRTDRLRKGKPDG